MPQFDRESPLRTQGFDFPDVVEVMLAGIETLLQHSKVRADKVTLVLHDVGSIVGVMLANKYPDVVKQVVMFDNGPVVDSADPVLSPDSVEAAVAAHPELGGCRKAVSDFVQLNCMVCLAIAFMLGRLCACLGYIQLRMTTFLVLNPPGSYILSPDNPLEWSGSGGCPRPQGEIRPFMGYHFYYLLKLRWSGKLDAFYRDLELPQVPCLFLYGQNKNTTYHTKELLAKMDATPGCVQRGLRGGHWVMLANPEGSLQEVAKFMGVKLGKLGAA